MNKIFKYKNKDWLYDQYWNKNKSSPQIAKECNVSKTIILRNLKKFNIKRRTSSQAHKGQKSWNKGKTNVYSKETLKKISENHADASGEKNPNWKEDKVGYVPIHLFIKKRKQKPEYCIICNEFKEKLECCSIDHTYTRDPNDYIYLCHSCHIVFDNIRRKNKLTKNSK